MSFVAIIGAGDVGGATARALSARGRVTAMRLIDEHASVAAGKALDLRQSAPIIGSDASIEASTDFASAVGASAIVLADAATRTRDRSVGRSVHGRPFNRVPADAAAAQCRRGPDEGAVAAGADNTWNRSRVIL